MRRGPDAHVDLYRGADRVRLTPGGIGDTGPEVCRKLGVSEQTFSRWKREFAGMGVAELRRLGQLEEENRRLKQLVADLTLDRHMLQEVIRKKLHPSVESYSCNQASSPR